MKKITTSLLAALFAVAAFAGNGIGDDEAKSVNVNTSKSTVYWTGKKVTGQHTGTLNLKGGSVTVENGVPVSTTIKLDMKTIVVTDIKDAETNAKLLGHLKSPDFFSVEKFPEGEFVATSFTPIKGASGDEANYTVKGTLTLKGKSSTVEFPANIKVKGDKVEASGKLSFDRTKYDIRYGSGSFFDGLGDNMIYDDVELNFVLTTK